MASKKKKVIRRKRVNWKVLILSIIGVYLIAWFGSLFSMSAVDGGWYEGVKPGLAPPNWVFGPVWMVLYFLIALSFYFAWEKSGKHERKLLGLVYGVNLVFNGVWSYLFFGLRNPSLAFLDLLLIWVSIIAMIFVSYDSSRKAGWLLAPYLLWVTFAGVLNLLIVLG